MFGADAPGVADKDWIVEATAHGLILLHKDKRIRYNPIEKAALIESRARSFALGNGNLTGADSASRLLEHWTEIEKAARRDGPYFYHVLEGGIESRKLD